MKNALIISLLMVLTFSLSAERFMLIQGTYLNSARSYEQNSVELKYNYHMPGISITTFNGNTLGLYTKSSFLFPRKGTASIKTGVTTISSTIDDEVFNFRLGLDLFMGLGYKIDLGKHVSLIPAVGPHFNGYIEFPKGDGLTSLSYILGAGGALEILFHLTENINLNIGGFAAYNFAEFVTVEKLSNMNKKGNLTFAVNAGLGFTY